ncbi:MULTISPECIES: helix-turn-helix domain-containing protein [Candidatus Ichthyocystis]|uniref:helix-turn-helix domain-containing protein n=1 Tax=Candidatus Ichthyocystis TaxID=2929841 RepID=UPI000B8A2FF9|nr:MULTISPECIES: helix-turn-helix domain-containing protein [Ichthyocystis]
MTQDSDDLVECLRKRIYRYFDDLDGAKPHQVYSMVIHAVERPLIEIILDKTRGNQTQAASILGIDRNTLRKKINLYKITADSGK